MNDDSKFWIIICSIVCLTICVISICCTIDSSIEYTNAFKHGYIQHMGNGSQLKYWIK